MLHENKQKKSERSGKKVKNALKMRKFRDFFMEFDAIMSFFHRFTKKNFRSYKNKFRRCEKEFQWEIVAEPSAIIYFP